MQDFFRIVQITDTHLFADPTQCLLGLNTQNSFAAVLQAITEQPWQADLFLLTGDLSQDETLPAYQRLAQGLSAFKIPTYWLPGNHDDYQNILAGLVGPNLLNDKVIIKNNWQIILLNSQVPGKVAGLLDQKELMFLQNCLQQYPQHHALVCLHHPPVPTGCAWLDPHNLRNPSELFAIIDQYPQVKAILNGHIHQDFISHHQQIPVYASPSTCIQFKPKAQRFELDIIPPGFRYLDLYSDGSIKTQIIRANKFTEHMQADPNAKGY